MAKTPPRRRDARHDALFDSLLSDIERDGWTVASSPGGKGPSRPPYVVTVGLPVTYDHPELIVLGTDDEDLHRAITAGLVEQIIDGARFDQSSKATVAGVAFTFVDVHPKHLEKLLPLHPLILASYTRRPPPLRALQVILPDRYFCACHAQVRYWLDDPRPLMPHRRSRRRPLDRPRRARP